MRRRCGIQEDGGEGEAKKSGAGSQDGGMVHGGVFLRSPAVAHTLAWQAVVDVLWVSREPSSSPISSMYTRRRAIARRLGEVGGRLSR